MNKDGKLHSCETFEDFIHTVDTPSCCNIKMIKKIVIVLSDDACVRN